MYHADATTYRAYQFSQLINQGEIVRRLKNMFMYVGLIVSLFGGSSALAGGTVDGRVVQFRFYEQHTGILVSLPNMIDPDSCGRSDWLILPKDHPYYREVYALLLSSHLADKKVSIIIIGCHQGLPRISHVTSVVEQ